VRNRSTATWAALASAAVLAAGCASGEVGDFPDNGATTDATEAVDDTATDADADGDGAEAPGAMPDLIGLDADEAVASLEDQGFQVSTGIVRTTEMEPGLVYRSEPAPGRQVREGQRVTLRIAGEPRE
jgi:hypothetical protein